MSRSYTAEGVHEFYHPTRDWEEEPHTLKVVMELEEGTDYEAYGSTYVPRHWCECSGETWFLDDLEVADWAFQHHLRVMGFTQEQVNKMKEKARDTGVNT